MQATQGRESNLRQSVASRHAVGNAGNVRHLEDGSKPKKDRTRRRGQVIGRKRPKGHCRYEPMLQCTQVIFALRNEIVDERLQGGFTAFANTPSTLQPARCQGDPLMNIVGTGPPGKRTAWNPTWRRDGTTSRSRTEDL